MLSRQLHIFFDFLDLLGRSWSQNSTSCAVTLAFCLQLLQTVSSMSFCCDRLRLQTFQGSEETASTRRERKRIYFGLLTECSCCVVATDVRDAFQLLRACKTSTSSAVGLRIDPPQYICKYVWRSLHECLSAAVVLCETRLSDAYWLVCWGPVWAWARVRGPDCPGSRTLPSDWVYWAEHQYLCAWHVLY